MYVILVYDISTVNDDGKKRLPKLMKVCRQYLHHTQKSVFEGEITEGKLEELRFRIENLLNEETDYVVIYRLENAKNLKRQNLGKNFDPTTRFL